jgi:hypothetical protein
MGQASGEDLGHGVRVAPGSGDELIVISPNLDLAWQAASGRAPGTAVLWRDHPYEVTAKKIVGAGTLWSLRPWPEAVTMRAVLTLDATGVAKCAEQAKAARRRDRGRWWALLVYPVLGLVPATLQQRLSERWGFSAEAATWTSAITEILLGGFGLVQGLALAFGGEWFLPPWLHWAVVVGPPMCIEGLVRLTLVGALREPVGSIAGLPLLLLEAGPTKVEIKVAPEVRVLDEASGFLELVSPEYRPDWHGDAVLPYRGRFFVLERTTREGRSWVYRFVVSGDPGPDGTRLRLLPPPGAPEPSRFATAKPPSIVATALMTAAVTLGPRDDQERWAAHLKVRPVWLTVAGAGAELVGGIGNLDHDLETGTPLLILLGIVLVGEGLLRLGSAASNRPMGSLFGMLLRPLYRRHLPDAQIGAGPAI